MRPLILRFLRFFLKVQETTTLRFCELLHTFSRTLATVIYQQLLPVTYWSISGLWDLPVSLNAIATGASLATVLMKLILPTSTPVVRTGVIPTCRSPSLPAVVSLSHGPRDCPASLSHLANDRPMHYWFFAFGLGAKPWAKVHQRAADLVYQPAKFHRCTPTHAEDICYQKSCRQTERQTNSKRNIPTCLWACGDNNN